MSSRRTAIGSAYAPSTAAAIYTCPTGMKAEVIQLGYRNVDNSSAYALTVYKVPSGGAAGDENSLVEKNIQPDGSDIVYEAYNMVLEAGDAIYTYCPTTSKITVNGSVREFTE